MRLEKNFDSLSDVIGDCTPAGLVAFDRAFAAAADAQGSDDAEGVATILRFLRARLDIAEAAASLYGVERFVRDQDRAGVVPLHRFDVDAPAAVPVPAAASGLSFRAVLMGLPAPCVALIGLALKYSGLVSAGGMVDRAWADVRLFVDEDVVERLDYEFSGPDGDGVRAVLDRAV